DSFLPAAGVEYYYYDQLGSGFSDQPEEPSLWDLDRFVDEVEQVRQALGLDRDSFVLYGQSWGGILGMEYALAHQQHLRALVISNMMASVPAYNAYAEQVLMPAMDQAKLVEIKALEAAGQIEDPRYLELLTEQHYVHHVLRLPPADWPDPVQRGFAHINPAIYVSMHGPSELGISADAKLAYWDRFADLASIEVPTLVIGARHDTMDPAHMQEMAAALPQGRYLYCPDGSHLAMYDDQQVYFARLAAFLHEVPKQPYRRPCDAAKADLLRGPGRDISPRPAVNPAAWPPTMNSAPVNGLPDQASKAQEARMSFQAYLDTVEAKTGKTPQQLVDEAGAKGLTQHGEILAWLKEDYGLGTGHARAIAHVIVHGPEFELKQTSGTHRDESGTLRLDGKAKRRK